MAQTKVSALPITATVLANTDLLLLTKDLGGGLYSSQKISIANVKISLGINGTLNILSKFTTGGGLVNSQVYDNGSGVGVNTVLGIAKLQVKGSGATDTTVALLIENSALLEMFKIKDNGESIFSQRVIVGDVSFFDNAIAFQVAGSQYISDSGTLNINTPVSFLSSVFGAKTGSNRNFRLAENDNIVTIQSLNDSLTDIELRYQASAHYIQGGDVGINNLSPTAKLHILGNGITSATSNFIAANSAGDEIFTVRDDKRIVYKDGNQAATRVLTSDANGVATWQPGASGTPITLNVIPKGTGPTIADGSWSFSGNHIFPNVDGSNIGITGTNRVGTIFMASTIDYASTFFLKEAGVNRVFINTGGNVGVNTTIPTAKLDVRGLLVSGAGNGAESSYDTCFLASRAAPLTGLQYAFEVGGGVWGIGFDAVTDSYRFLGGTTAKFSFSSGSAGSPTNVFSTIDLSNKWFGIGTTSMASTLHVKGFGATSASSSLIVENSSSIELFRVRDDGNVGVKTSSLLFLLSLTGNSANTVGSVRNSITASDGNNLTIQAGGSTLTGSNKNGGALVLRSGQSTGIGTSYMAWELPTTNGVATTDGTYTERMRLLSTGNFGVGGVPTNRFEVFTSNPVSKFRFGHNIMNILGAATNAGFQISRTDDGDYTAGHGFFDQNYRLIALARNGMKFVELLSNANPVVQWEYNGALPTFHFGTPLVAPSLASSFFRIRQSTAAGPENAFLVTQEKAVGNGNDATGIKIDVTGASPVKNTGLLISVSGAVTNNYGIIVTSGLNGFGTTSPSEMVDITGNLKLNTAGNGIKIKEGSNATMGIATMIAGTVTVSTTKVTANSRIFLTVNGGTLTNVGAVYVSARSAGTSFTISSVNILDTSDVAWMIVEPA